MDTQKLIVNLDQEAMLRVLWLEIVKANNVTSNRDRRNVTFRHIFCVCARQLSSISLKSIGRILGKDHATVLYALRRHEWLMTYDASYLSIYDTIYAQVAEVIETNSDATMRVLKDRMSGDNARLKIAEDSLTTMYQDKLNKLEREQQADTEELKKQLLHFKKYAKELYARNERLQTECLRLKNLI